MVLYSFRWNIHPDKTEVHAAWYGRDDVQQVIAEAHTLATGVTWEQSPIVPQQIRPGGGVRMHG